MKSYQIPFKLYDEDHLIVKDGDTVLTKDVDYKVINDLTRVVELKSIESISFRRMTDVPDGELFTTGNAVDATTLNNICDVIEAAIRDRFQEGEVGSGLLASNNLSDLSSVIEARMNLDVYSKAQVDTLLSYYCTRSDNLLSLLNKATSRTNLDVYSKSEWDAVLAALADSTYTREDFEIIWDCNAKLALDSGYDITISPVGDGKIVVDFEEVTLSTDDSITITSPVSDTIYYIYATTVGFSFTTDAPTVLFNGKLGYGTFPEVRPLVGIAYTGSSGVLDVRSVIDVDFETKEYDSDAVGNTYVAFSGDVVETTVTFDIIANASDVDLNVKFNSITESYGSMSQDLDYNVTATITCDAEEDTAINVWPTICDGETEFTVSNLSIVSIRKPYGWRQTSETGYTTTIDLNVQSKQRTKIFSWDEDTSSDAYGWDEGYWES